MSENKLWNILSEIKSDDYEWVDLSHEFSPETPHWFGFQPLSGKKIYDYRTPAEGDTFEEAPMRVYEYTFVGQYGTHVDIPSHFDGNGRNQNDFHARELSFPLVVIDKSGETARDNDFHLSKEDIIEWENENGRIPEGAFVALRTDWSKRGADNFDNYDEQNVPHYPGWDVDAIKFLVEERNIGAIGHETADTDPGYITSDESHYPYPAEKYILDQNRLQVELLKNLDKLPPVGAVIFVTFPILKEGTGFPARVFAVRSKVA